MTMPGQRRLADAVSNIGKCGVGSVSQSRTCGCDAALTNKTEGMRLQILEQLCASAITTSGSDLNRQLG
jgi:hypothetical protein